VFADEFAQPQAFIQLAHHEQATVGRHSRSLQIDFQRGVEGELKRLILLFTHWVQASGASVAPSKPHGYWRWLDHTITYLNFKKEM
jgi:hypothetical protein